MCYGARASSSDLDFLGSSKEEIQDPVAGGSVQSEQVQFADQLLGDDGTENWSNSMVVVVLQGQVECK